MTSHPLLARLLADELMADRLRDAQRRHAPVRVRHADTRPPIGLARRIAFSLLRLPYPAPAPGAC